MESAGEIVQLLKKSVDEPPESQESESVLNKTAAHVSESLFMLDMYHVAQKLRQEISSNSYNNCVCNNTENAYVAYLRVSMHFSDCFVQVKIQQSMRMTIGLCADVS